MADDFDPLTSTLRAIARDDAADAERRLGRVEARLLAETRALRSERASDRFGRAFGLAMAATLLIAVTVSLWTVGRGAPGGTGPRSNEEVSTAFIPLTYHAVPYTDATIVRIQVPRSALVRFGLATVDTIAPDEKETVLADVLVAEDGLARAVRFVRAARATSSGGVMP